ncbi:hypothetical protein D3C83_24130 [compost metagenome]
MIRPSSGSPPWAVNSVIVGVVCALTAPAIVSPGMELSSAPYDRVAGSDSRTVLFRTVSRRVLCTSTTGVSPETVIVSCRLPIRMSTGIVSVAEPASSIPSRLTVEKPSSEQATV